MQDRAHSQSTRPGVQFKDVKCFVVCYSISQEKRISPKTVVDFKVCKRIQPTNAQGCHESTRKWTSALCLNAIYISFAECLCSLVYWQMTSTEDRQWQWAQCLPTAQTHGTVCSRAASTERSVKWVYFSLGDLLLVCHAGLFDDQIPAITLCICVHLHVRWLPLMSTSSFSSCCRAETERGLNRKHIIEGNTFFFFPLFLSAPLPRPSCHLITRSPAVSL